MVDVTNMYLILLILPDSHACQADLGHWEFQIQLYGNDLIVILNQTRLDPSQHNIKCIVMFVHAKFKPTTQVGTPMLILQDLKF